MVNIVDPPKAGGQKLIDSIAERGQDALETLGGIFEFRVDIVLLRGKIRGGDEDFALLYVGRRINLPHFTKKYFSEVETAHSKKATLLTFRRHMKAVEDQADVVFVDIGWPYNGRINKDGAYLELPDWVCMVVPFEKEWDATVLNFRKTMRKNIGRLIRRNNYRCEPTNDPEMIERFYDDYYVPFINSRHAGEAFLTSRALLERRAREGTILQVMGDDGLVAAGVYYEEDGYFHLLDAGMPAAYIDNPPEAAIWALYYFSLRHGFDRGCKGMNLMGTRAFPTDGVFQFKRKWGAKVDDSFSTDSILFKPMNNSAKAARFCEQFPFIARKNGALELVLGATGDAFGDTEKARMLADHYCEGIAQVKVVHLSDQDTPPVFSDNSPNVRLITSDLENFADRFTRQ